MRVYDLRVAALALDVPLKWMDNLISQHQVMEVSRQRRGVARRISHVALVHMALARDLHQSMGLGVREAIQLSRRLLVSPDETALPIGHLRVSVDRSALERALDARLREVLESAPAPRRGRPPRRHLTK